MVDFDRSRLGPCSYDVVRFLVSVSLRSAERRKALLSEPVLESFRRGYAHGVLSRALGYEEMLHLRGLRPKRWQESTRAYVRSRRRWAAKLEAFAVDPAKKRMRALLKHYLRNRDELHVLERYRVHRAAKVPGSQGKLHHVYWLRPRRKDADAQRDDLLLDVKEVYDEPTKAACQVLANAIKVTLFGASLGFAYSEQAGLILALGSAAVVGTLLGKRLLRSLSPARFVLATRLLLAGVALKVLLGV